MGLTSVGAPSQTALALARISGATSFIETGTFCGGTTQWASKHFQRVYTIELSKTLYRAHSDRLKRLGNVETYLGDSREMLPNILAKLDQRPAVFWLDGHWSGVGTSGEEHECPLLEELRLISGRKQDIILIDDARLFLAAPPAPNNPTAWPDIYEVIRALGRESGERFVQIFDDVIFAVPNQGDVKDHLIREAQHLQRTLGISSKIRMALSMLAVALTLRRRR